MNCHYLSVSYDTWLGAIWFVTGVLNWPATLAPASSRPSRLAGGTFSSQVKSSATQRLHISQAGCEICEVEQQICMHDKCLLFSLFVLIQNHKIDRRMEWKERKNNKCGMAGLLGMSVDSLWKPRREGSIQYMLPPLAWLKRGMDEGCELNNFIPWIIQG